MSINNYILKIFFLVSKINKTVGDSIEIFWTAPFFPRAGDYNIYHTNEQNKSIPIISVTSNKVTTQNRKYEYLSQPLYSTNITFMIRDITLGDAGYYAGGLDTGFAISGGGVVLIVLGESTEALPLFIVDSILSYHFALLSDICIVVFLINNVNTNEFRSLICFYHFFKAG